MEAAETAGTRRAGIGDTPSKHEIVAPTPVTGSLFEGTPFMTRVASQTLRETTGAPPCPAPSGEAGSHGQASASPADLSDEAQISDANPRGALAKPAQVTRGQVLTPTAAVEWVNTLGSLLSAVPGSPAHGAAGP